MHQIEIVRLCAIWDTAGADKENIPTVIELIDDEKIIETLAAVSHRTGTEGYNLTPSRDPKLAAIEHEEYRKMEIRFGLERAVLAKTELKQAIVDAQAILSSPRLASVMNLRDK